MVDLELAVATQSIIKADVSQTKEILAAMNPEKRARVIEQFRTNARLRMLFPEYVDLVVDEN